MPAPLTIKTLLNQYRIEEFTTTTPLGELYRATEERSQKAIALTILSPSITGNSEELKALEANSIRLQGISHPNLNPYHGLYKTSTQIFIVEDWVDGPTLKTVHERGRLAAEETLFIAKSICGAGNCMLVAGIAGRPLDAACVARVAFYCSGSSAFARQ